MSGKRAVEQAQAPPTITSTTFAPWIVPYPRNPCFSGRDAEISHIETILSSNTSCQRAAIAGRSGVGKTQIALEFAYRTRERQPDCSVFWIPVTNVEGMLGVCLEIGRQLQIPNLGRDKADILKLVQHRLSQESSGRWLLIVDDADIETWSEKANNSAGLPFRTDYLPWSKHGSILFMTRSWKAAMKLAGRDVVMVAGKDDIMVMDKVQKSLLYPHRLSDSNRWYLIHLQAGANIMDKITLAECATLLDDLERKFCMDFQTTETSPIILAANNIGAGELDALSFENKLALAYKAGRELFKQGIETHKLLHWTCHPDTLASKSDLTLRYMEGWKTVRGLLQQVIETHKLIVGANRPDTMTSKNDLTLTHMNRWEAVRGLFQQVIEIYRFILGSDSPDKLAIMNTLALTYNNQSRGSVAQELMEQLVKTRRETLIADHQDTVTTFKDMELELINWRQGRWNDSNGLDMSEAVSTKHPSVFSFDQTGYTDQTSLSQTPVDMEQYTGNPSPMTFFSHKSLVEHESDKKDDDIRSVESIPDDIDSLAESTLGMAHYREAAVKYLVKVFTADSELLGLYREATRRMDGSMFVKNNRRLLKRFFLDLQHEEHSAYLRHEQHSASQKLAVEFLRSRSKRIHISSEICRLLMPSDNTIQEKINIMLKRQQGNLSLLERFLNEEDSAPPLALTNAADTKSDGEPNIQRRVGESAGATSKESIGSDDDKDLSGDESEPEIEDDTTLSKLAVTAEYLTYGRPFSLYKDNLRAILYPVHKAPALPEAFELGSTRLGSKRPLSDHGEDERGNAFESRPLEVQTSDTTQPMRIKEDPKEALSRPEKPEEVSGSIHLLSNLTRQRQARPVTVTWECRCGAIITDQYMEYIQGAVQTFVDDRMLRYRGGANAQNTSPRTQGWVDSMRGTLNQLKKSFFGKQKQSEEATKPPVSDGGSTESPPASNLTGPLKHLQLCISRYRRYTQTSYSSHCLNIESDKVLYDLLRAEYTKLAGRWKRRLSLRQISQIRFVKFRLRTNNFVSTIEAHSKMESRIRDSLPPEHDIDYDFAPPEPDFLPPIGHNEMLHYFNTSCRGQDDDFHIRHFPGHKLNPVPFQPGQEQKHVWGIELVESESRQWLYLSIPVFFVICLSMGFGVAWAVVRQDIQGGFTVATYIVTGGLSFLGSVQVYLDFA